MIENEQNKSALIEDMLGILSKVYNINKSNIYHFYSSFEYNAGTSVRTENCKFCDTVVAGVKVTWLHYHQNLNYHMLVIQELYF